ncbi:Brp/Blh family beta-carotene 15,15'-dioxygenase [Algoriphagus sp.]|uniref:Brp/Blh family beta-carotene 15,15'-dioxygenase n=1 Tax=Algoriphagus sp. TaxID=1872435 RepID=UPI00391B118A
MNRIENIAKALGIILCLIFMLFFQNNLTVQLALFGVILIAVGIPHGAIDHLISNPKIDQKGLFKFLLIYISMIAGYSAVWYFIPVVALLAFLFMSAYHFGQSHFFNESSLKNYSLLLYVSRGGYFLFAILLGDWEATKLILSPLVNLEYLNNSRLFVLGAFLFSTLLAQNLFGPKFGKKHILELVILGPILYLSPLLIGFVVYFGFWHALPSMMTEYKFLRSFKAYDSFKKFAIQLLPFSLISFVGIGLILFFGLEFLDNTQLILLFFVLISLISFPHIFYMDSFLKKQN